MDEKRLIEVDFALKEVSQESAREKNIRHGHISTLHIWWARRPLAASRATTFGALVPAPKDHDRLRKKLEFLGELSKWENSLNHRLIEKGKKEIGSFSREKAPKVLDCFAGGGAIPLEALRLGCETYALEYNPVAVVLLKAVLEYPQRFGQGKKRMIGGIRSTGNPLVRDVKKWHDWVLQEAKNDIAKFYPSDPDGSVPLGYVWAKTIRCKNPSCQTEIPLIKQFWLAKKTKAGVALKMVLDKKGKKIEFQTIQEGKLGDFDPSKGTTTRATVMCPFCGAGMKGKSVRKEAREGRMGERLVAVILHKPNERGKIYRTANQDDIKLFHEAEKYLERKIENWKWDFDPIPNEPTPSGGGPGAERAFSLRNYGLDRWRDLFNNRQKLALITFVEKTKLAHEKMVEQGYEKEYARVICTYLALAVDRLADFGSRLCVLNPTGGRGIVHTFGRNALPVVWDYTEFNPFYEKAAGWPTACKKNEAWIKHASTITEPGDVVQGTATRLPYSDGFFDAVITDPPYYDNVPYSDLSDFFYVWLKRTVGELYPDLFATPLTPKSQEIVLHTLRHGNSIEKAKKYFEDMIAQSFQEIRRVLKPSGIAVIVFAYKSTDAWETIINGLLKSGLVLTASWPIHTERTGRLRAQESAALASSVYMVCRKRSEEKTAYFNEVREQIDQRIKEKLSQFWEQGISGADFFVSAIGPAVEVFGRYSKVEKLSGEEVSVQELLEYVRKIVSEFALERVLKRADLGGVDAETRFYLLWRWTFGNAKVHFDDAIKLSRPMGVELTDLWDKGGFVKKEKEYVRVLDPKARAQDQTSMRKTKFTSMIDVLQHAVILWEQRDKEKIKEILDETGLGGNEIFWQTAQAISEVLPQGDKEKQLLQGFLYGKEVYIKEARGKKTLLDFVEE